MPSERPEPLNDFSPPRGPFSVEVSITRRDHALVKFTGRDFDWDGVRETLTYIASLNPREDDDE